MKISLWSFLVLFSSALASPLLEKRHSYSFVGCDAGQQNTINEILDDMQDLAAAAARNSEGGIPSAAYEAWFGDGSGQKVSNENVNTRFHKLSIFKTSVPKKDVAFDCTEKSPCCSLGLYVSATAPQRSLPAPPARVKNEKEMNKRTRR